MVRVSTAGVGMLVAWLAVNAGGVARAADASDPIAEGIRLRKAGHDQEALVLFQRALAQTPSAKAAAQLGLCEHALGMHASTPTASARSRTRRQTRSAELR